jgi:predicted dehydrogenase
MLKVAIVGLGWWGRIMTTLITRHSSRLKVVRLVDSNLAAAREVGTELQIPASSQLDDALHDPEVAAVILATPHSFHEEQIAAAARAGKHVFCEKPLGLSLESVSRSVAGCRRAQVVLGVGHERRFEEPILDLWALLDAGELGTPLQIEANFSHDRFVGLSKANWRLSHSEAPAAGMTGPGIHLLDLAVWLLGPAQSTVAHVATLATDLPCGDTLSALVRHTSGATTYLSATLATPFVARFALFGSRGWVEIRDKAHVENPQGWRVIRQLAGRPLEEMDYAPTQAVLANLEAFAAAVAGTRDYPVSHADMLATVAAMESVFQSTRSGGSPVDVTVT